MHRLKYAAAVLSAIGILAACSESTQSATSPDLQPTTASSASPAGPPPGTAAAPTPVKGASSRKAPAPAARISPESPVSAESYLRPGTTDVVQFSAGSGHWQCVITAERAGCTGDSPYGPDAQLAGQHPDGFEVTAAGVSSFTEGSAEVFTPRDETGRPVAGKELPVGRSLPTGQFVCVAVPGDGVQCETSSGDDGFLVRPMQSVLW